MIDFNSDGSIKLPEFMSKHKQEKEDRLKKGKCVLIKKEAVSFTAPKKCMLHLRLSDAITDTKFIETIYRQFNQNSKVPSKILKINEKEFDIEIGTHFMRCSDCSNLIKRFREFLYDNVIEEKGNCTYEIKSKNFCYEDYFE